MFPIGLDSKKEPNDSRTIQRLSYPKGNSVNDYRDPDVRVFHYASFDRAFSMVQNLGKGALLFELNIK